MHACTFAVMCLELDVVCWQKSLQSGVGPAAVEDLSALLVLGIFILDEEAEAQ